MKGRDVSFAIKQPRVVSLGAFDGVHIAHVAVLSAAKKRAESRGVPSCVFTFYKDPSFVLGKPQKALLSFENREDRIFSQGIDEIFYAEFDEKMLNTEAEEFYLFLKEKLSPECIVCGHNYTFGKMGKGNVSLLSSLCEKDGTELIIVDRIELEDTTVSSTRIRELIEKGDIHLANKLLGYGYTLCGNVCEGNKIGRKLGFPTANIPIDESFAVPSYGVYLSRVKLENKTYNAITNIGIKPTVTSDIPLAESYMFGIDRELYGEKIEVSLIERIRGEKKFPDIEALKTAVLADIQVAKDYFGE